jgi:hypothetical protein
MSYIGYNHVIVFDKSTYRMAAYDLRDHPASPQCDIMHYPPVAPPTALSDHVLSRSPADLRLIRLSGVSAPVFCASSQPTMSHGPEYYRDTIAHSLHSLNPILSAPLTLFPCVRCVCVGELHVD